MRARKIRTLSEALSHLEEHSAQGIFAKKKFNWRFVMDNKQHSVIKDIGAQAKQKFEYVQGQGLKMSKKAVKSVDSFAHRKPWYMVGVFAAFAGFFGFLLGRKSKDYKGHNHK